MIRKLQKVISLFSISTDYQVTEYLNHVAALGQLLHMSKQILQDTLTLSNHKYMAHQIALLYVHNN